VCLVILFFAVATSRATAGNYFQGITPTAVPWPGGIIPYIFDTNYTITMQEKSVILAGLREWELAANVHFIPYTTQANYVQLQFTNDGSGTGYCLLGTPATLMLHGLARGLICHEGGHLLGLQHEHQRNDRDSYIVVNYNNVLGATNGESAFTIDTHSTSFGPYDMQSVMHYGPDTFTNGLGDSLDPLPPYAKYYHKIGNLALSAGDRAAVANLYGPPSTPLTNIVTTTADGGFGSLRAAIYYANDHPGATIQFNIPTNDPGYSNAVFTISLIGEPPPLLSAGTVIDGTSQPGYAGTPIIAVDGSQVSPEAQSVSGLHFYGTNCTARALAFDHFNDAGIQLFCSDAVSNHIEGCYLGVAPDGTHAAPNNLAGIIFQYGATNNFIGNTNPAARNVISGNRYYGILINDTNSDGNVIQGNNIGLDASGSIAVPNQYSGIGVFYDPKSTIIGGTNAGARNVISGNLQDGIYLEGTNNTGTAIQGNYIGTDATGNFAVPNQLEGIGIYGGARNVTIGGATAGAANLVSGNVNSGVSMAGDGVTNIIIQGNFMGVNAEGTAALPNGQAGVLIYNGSSDNLIGGFSAAAANVLSGNLLEGVYISDPNTSDNIVAGNFIGTDLTGSVALGNGDTGVGLWSGTFSNLVAGNLLSANTNYGVAMGGADDNIVCSNLIGTDISGTNTTGAGGTNLMGNGTAGIGIWGGATNNFVGGLNPGDANVLSGNGTYGVYISDAGTANNFIQGNFIGTDRHGTNGLPNGVCGIGVWSSASGNLIGGTTPAAANILSGNRTYGVVIGGPGADENTVQGNFIGTDLSGTHALANGFAGLAIWGASLTNLVGGPAPGAANVISGNGFYGVFISDTNTSGNLVAGNFIGTDSTGTNAVANGAAGVEIQQGASANEIGGVTTGYGNVIAFNGGPGVLIDDPGTTNDSFQGNSIFGNLALGIDLNNDGVTPDHLGFLAGPNDLQNYPVITNATATGNSMLIGGTLNSLPNQTYTVDFYRNPMADASGYGQGQFYLGSVTVTTDGSGNGAFAYTNSSANNVGQFISATATSAGGDTSEFSADVLVSNVTTPSATFNPSLRWTGTGFVFSLTLTTNFSYRIQTTTNLAAHPIVWTDLTNFMAITPSLTFTEQPPTGLPARFYRVISP
jgi:titin